MARTTLTPSVALGSYGAAGVVLTFTAADTTNQNRVLWTGRSLIIAKNTGASARTVTITSAPHGATGRLGSISAYSIAAGATAMLGPYSNPDGWRQSDGYLYLEANNAEVEFAVVTLPANN